MTNPKIWVVIAHMVIEVLGEIFVPKGGPKPPRR